MLDLNYFADKFSIGYPFRSSSEEHYTRQWFEPTFLPLPSVSPVVVANFFDEFDEAVQVQLFNHTPDTNNINVEGWGSNSGAYVQGGEAYQGIAPYPNHGHLDAPDIHPDGWDHIEMLLYFTSGGGGGRGGIIFYALSDDDTISAWNWTLNQPGFGTMYTQLLEGGVIHSSQAQFFGSYTDSLLSIHRDGPNTFRLALNGTTEDTFVCPPHGHIMGFELTADIRVKSYRVYK